MLDDQIIDDEFALLRAILQVKFKTVSWETQPNRPEWRTIGLARAIEKIEQGIAQLIADAVRNGFDIDGLKRGRDSRVEVGAAVKRAKAAAGNGNNRK